MKRYDMVVIGVGIHAARTAVSPGTRVALVDRAPLGGTGVNRG